MFFQQFQPIQALYSQHIVANVQVDSDAVYNERKELSFDTSRLNVRVPEYGELPGRLLISGFGEPIIFKGVLVQVEGKVYSTRVSRQLRMSFADMEVLKSSGSPVDSMRRNFAAGMETALPEPQASFEIGLLIGQRSTSTDMVTATLSIVGLTHIIAVSG